MESEELQIALKSDLYPVFDPRILDFKVEKAVLNTDAIRLYLLDGTGQLHCMKLPLSLESKAAATRWLPVEQMLSCS